MEVDPADDGVLEVVEGLVVFEVDVEAVLDAHLHLHRHHLGITFNCLVRQQHREVLLFGD